jgi:hypothetical protein
MPIKVELDAYVIPDSHTVWKCSPGKTYRFYVAVKDAFTAFPDVRGLETIGGKPSDWTDQQILRVIAEDRRNREAAAVARGRKDAQIHEGVIKSDRAVLTFVKRIWFEAKLGDLIVIPAEGYDKEVLIGEILSDPGELRRVEAKDGDYVGDYFGRPVAWRLGIPKFELDADLIKVLHTRAAVFPMGKTARLAVYRLAYRNFVYHGEYVAEFRTAKQHFTAEDAAVVSAWLNAFSVLQYSLDAGQGRREGEAFAMLGLSELPDQIAGDLRININSPGEIFMRTKTPLALTLMALFALSGCDAQKVVNDGVTVKLKSVAGAANEPQKAVESDVNGLTTAMGEDRLTDGNNFAKRAAKDAKMSTLATLKSDHDGPNHSHV